MKATITTIVSDAIQTMPVDSSATYTTSHAARNIKAMCRQGLPVVVLHSQKKDSESVDYYRGLCKEYGAKYISAEHNTFYGGGINLLVEHVQTEAMIYMSSTRSRIHNGAFVEKLLRPLYDPHNGVSGCIQPCDLRIVSADAEDVEQIHVQGGIWASRTDVLKAVPFGNEFPQVYSDVHHGLKIRRCGYHLASAEGIGAIASGALMDPLRYDAISDYRSWQTINNWRYDFGNGYGNADGPKALDDGRPDLFFQEFSSVKDVLELGSFEANHTFRLAPNLNSVTTIEGRHENQAKAEWVKEWFNIDNVKAYVCDVRDTIIPKSEAIYCSGLLYHLDKPIAFLKKLSKATNRLFLWTHVAHGVETNEGHAGKWMPEFGYEDMLSGLQPRSFWLTEEELLKALHMLDYSTKIVDRENKNGQEAITLTAWRV